VVILIYPNVFLFIELLKLNMEECSNHQLTWKVTMNWMWSLGLCLDILLLCYFPI